jgi:hypothetical protein
VRTREAEACRPSLSCWMTWSYCQPVTMTTKMTVATRFKAAYEANIFQNSRDDHTVGVPFSVAWHFDAADERRQFLVSRTPFNLGFGRQLHAMPQ